MNLLWCSEEDGAGLPMGMKTFCRFPMVTGDWVVLARGDDACPVGDENVHGVADRELLSDTSILATSVSVSSNRPVTR